MLLPRTITRISTIFTTSVLSTN